MDAAESDLHPYELTGDEGAGIEEALLQARRGEFASDEEVATMWNRGLTALTCCWSATAFS